MKMSRDGTHPKGECFWPEKASNLRLVLDVEVQAGNQIASSYTAPVLWSLLERIPQSHLPLFLRGDCAFGSDPLLLQAVGKQTSHAGQTRITISSTHGKIEKVRCLLNRIASFFSELRGHAEQLSPQERWYRILSKALEKYLQGCVLKPPDALAAPG